MSEEQQFKRIAENDPSLSSVDLSNGRFREQDVEEFCNAVANNSHLKYINLSNNNLNDSNVKVLSKALATCPNLEVVDLTLNYLSTLAGYFVLRAFGTRHKIVNLGLLMYESVMGDAKVRLEMFHGISPSRTEELLARDKFHQGLKYICEEFTQRHTEVKPPSFGKHEEYTMRVMRKVLFLDFIDQHPDVRNVPVESPIVITGLYRTGTTMLFNLMGLCEGVRVPKLWEIYSPTPPPTEDTYLDNPRIEEAEKRLAFMRQNGYVLEKMHELRAQWPEECMFVMREDHFYTETNLNQTFLQHGYGEWFNNQSIQEVYDNVKLFLQVISYDYRPKSHWVLKAPYHLFHLDTLLHTFAPDVRLVFCHRDPMIALASAFSLWCTIAVQEWTNYDPRPAARHMLKRFADGWNLTMDILDDLKAQGKEDLVFHVYYKDLTKDPVAVVSRIHAYFRLAPPSREKLQAWLDENPSGKHGQHKYTLEEYGDRKSVV